MLGKQRLARVSLGLWAISSVVAFATQPYDTTSADACYQQAMDAAERGDLTASEAALQKAVQLDPNHEPSRAERGEFLSDGRWVSVEYAQQLAADNPARSEYRQRRAVVGERIADHVSLANWCERTGLKEEARPHWIYVLLSDPQDQDALKALDAEWRNGQLVEARVAREWDEQARSMRRAEKAWEKRIGRLERERGDRDSVSLAKFREEVDASAGKPIERRVAALDQGRTRLNDRRREIAYAFIEATQDLPAVETTATLCRIATQASDSLLRRTASEALSGREKFDVMPLLLANLKSPIETECSVSMLPGGGVGYTHRLVAEGAEVDRVIERRHKVIIPTAGIEQFPSIDQQVDALFQVRVGHFKAQRLFTNEAEAVESQVAAYNQAVQEVNGRVVEVLKQTTEVDLGDQPRAWWDYWQRYSGYDVPYQRPVERQYETSSTTQPAYSPPPQPSRCECFVAGTQVWLRDGRKAIEDIRPGDLVLARDPHRGGLTYRAVLDTTVRQPSPMVEVVAGEESIRATVGHPFWVLGQGWRMAKQLSEGDVLSTIDGPLTVTAINDSQQAMAFNLVVEGAANYYVGEHGVLVHDNTPRRPAVGLVASR